MGLLQESSAFILLKARGCSMGVQWVRPIGGIGEAHAASADPTTVHMMAKPSTAGPILCDEKIVDSWLKNASPWIEAVRDQQIESRQLVTNQAILDAIVHRAPSSVIDIGCGEGWLAHQLGQSGISVLGTDVVSELIAAAKSESRGRFQVVSYEQIAEGFIAEKFDMAVCNFSLFGKESVDQLFLAFPQIVNKDGFVLVQTIHPLMGTGDLPYVNGWRAGSWAGFSNQFTDPAPWFFRTLETWVELFTKNGLSIEEICEPVHPKTGRPASVIFVGRNNR